MYFYLAFWHSVGSYHMQTRIDSGPCQNCDNSKLTSAHLYKIAEGYDGAYGVLQNIYKRVCANHDTDGEAAKEIGQVHFD